MQDPMLNNFNTPVMPGFFYGARKRKSKSNQNTTTNDNEIRCLYDVDSDVIEICPKDFTIHHREQSFRVHKVLLCSVSGYFKNLPGIKDIQEYQMPEFMDFSTAMFSTVLRCIDKGSFKVETENVAEVIKIISLLCLNTSIESRLLEKFISPDTVIDIYKCASSVGNHTVREKCEEYLIKNFLQDHGKFPKGSIMEIHNTSPKFFEEMLLKNAKRKKK